ncbi:MAG: hypothetical protein ACK5JG_13870, partial [Pseudomonadota bacterium]
MKRRAVVTAAIALITVPALPLPAIAEPLRQRPAGDLDPQRLGDGRRWQGRDREQCTGRGHAGPARHAQAGDAGACR